MIFKDAYFEVGIIDGDMIPNHNPVMADPVDSLKDLFQQEFSKMVAVISRLYGLEHIELAEDIVSETFLAAAETWGTKGLPVNPTAWLYLVAKQKTLHHFRRNKIFTHKVLPVIKEGRQAGRLAEEPDFSSENIKDSQLRMIFAICNPAITSEAQIGLALRILCGFGIVEIAEAFLSNKETINKRLFRAKEKLRNEGVELELPADEALSVRLDNVLRVVYLLFNEGYYSRTQNEVLRHDLCFEALRLALMLAENRSTDKPRTHALIALMCFHASRFDARQMPGEAMVLYADQDESLWDQELILQGMRHLSLSLNGNELSTYHLEARIAYWHCTKEDSLMKWQEILELYDQLLSIDASPAAALNRIYALHKVAGAAAALRELNQQAMPETYFYYLLLAELYTSVDKRLAREAFEKALSHARTGAERAMIGRKIQQLPEG